MEFCLTSTDEMILRKTARHGPLSTYDVLHFAWLQDDVILSASRMDLLKAHKYLTSYYTEGRDPRLMWNVTKKGTDFVVEMALSTQREASHIA